MRNAALALLAFLAALPAVAADWHTGKYVYDGTGNVKSIGPDEQFRYDARTRLKSVTGSERAQSFTYDRYGNLETIVTGPDTIRLGVDEATNRLTDRTANVFGTYDGRGRLVSELDGAGNSFAYDATDTVVGATIDGVPVVHLYGPDDERLATVTVSDGVAGASSWTFRNQLDAVIRRLSSDGGQWTWSEDYVMLGGRTIAAETSAPEGTLHFFADHLGSPRLMTGNGGVEVDRRLYSAFGNEIAGRTLATEKTGFTGHESDSRSLHYMHARYYNQDWGRFLSVDTAFGNLRDPGSWNRYTYARNNPFKYIDLDGLSYLVFVRADHRLSLYSNDHRLLGNWSAANLTTSDSNGPWPSGVFTMLDRTEPHTHGSSDSTRGAYGPYGIFRAEPFYDEVAGVWRTGMGVHSGRSQGDPFNADAQVRGICNPTYGCVRTTDDAMRTIIKTAANDPLEHIFVTEEEHSFYGSVPEQCAPPACVISERADTSGWSWTTFIQYSYVPGMFQLYQLSGTLYIDGVNMTGVLRRP